MTGTWEDFEGIELLDEGIEKVVGTVLLRNELGGISSGYELSHAGIGNSGYSFGGNQLDLANNNDAPEILEDILINTVDDGNPNTSNDGQEFYNSIASKILIQGNPNALDATEIEIINNSLASNYGKDIINNSFKQEIQEAITYIDGIISSLPKGNIKETLVHSEELRTALVDYHNQFGLSPNGQMNNYLSGNIVTLPGGSAELQNMVTVEDIRDFIGKTLFGTQNPSDVARRQTNIDETLSEFSIGKYLSGNDQIQNFVGTAHKDTLIGGAGNDQLEGGSGTDEYRFSSNHDVDTITDGGADDRLVLDGATIKKAELAKDGQGNYALQGYAVTHDETANTLTSANDNFLIDIEKSIVKVAI